MADINWRELLAVLCDVLASLLGAAMIGALIWTMVQNGPPDWGMWSAIGHGVWLLGGLALVLPFSQTMKLFRLIGENLPWSSEEDE